MLSVNLPKQSGLTADEMGRVTQGAALALKARVALYQGTWTKYHGESGDYASYISKAIEAANTVVASNEYALYTGRVPIVINIFSFYREMIVKKSFLQGDIMPIA